MSMDLNSGSVADLAGTLPPTMRAVECAVAGGPEVMALAEVPVPVPRAGEVLIRVGYAGVNRPDLLQRAGRYPPPANASPRLGLEVAGTVVDRGDGVALPLGATVCALTPGGGYAEYAVAPAAHCLPVPAGVSPREAAGLPETCFTVWTNVFERARLSAGEVFLVHGGSSGIGTTAIQMARLSGARVFATAGSADKVAACIALGAEAAFDYREVDFVAALREATGGRGADVILDMVGGDYLPRNITALAPDGRLVNIAFLKGSKVEVDFLPVMMKRLTISGSTLRARSDADKAAIAAAIVARVWPWLADGRMRVVVDSVFPLAQAADAHRRMEVGSHIGKILLAVAGES
jgi:NADPH2:quinone reductase